jgi:predicted phosphodiesterase
MRATHSDTFLNIGNPGMTLKMKVIEEKINKINASLKDMHEVKVFLLGHTHVPVVTQMSNGSFVLINGSTQPPTPFTISMDILETSNVQLMFETTSEFAVGDLRFIQLNKSGADSSLDQLIPPWPGLNS